MHQYLRYTDKENPKLMFFNTCHNAIRTIPSLIHDEIKPEDLDTASEDHAADAIRYLLMSLKESRGERAKTEIEKKLDALKNQANDFNNLYQ